MIHFKIQPDYTVKADFFHEKVCRITVDGTPYLGAFIRCGDGGQSKWFEIGKTLHGDYKLDLNRMTNDAIDSGGDVPLLKVLQCLGLKIQSIEQVSDVAIETLGRVSVKLDGEIFENF